MVDFIIKFGCWVLAVDFLDEVFKLLFRASPYHEDIINVSQITIVEIFYFWLYECFFEFTHTDVGIATGTLSPHCTSFSLKVLTTIEYKVTKCQNQFQKHKDYHDWSFRWFLSSDSLTAVIPSLCVCKNIQFRFGLVHGICSILNIGHQPLYIWL